MGCWVSPSSCPLRSITAGVLKLLFARACVCVCVLDHGRAIRVMHVGVKPLRLRRFASQVPVRFVCQ